MRTEKDISDACDNFEYDCGSLGEIIIDKQLEIIFLIHPSLNNQLSYRTNNLKEITSKLLVRCPKHLLRITKKKTNVLDNNII